MTEPGHFGARLRELREQAGLTREQLAERTGLKIGGIRDIEQGVNKAPRWDNVVALAQALGVDCTAFQEKPSADTTPRGRGRPAKPSPAPPAGTTVSKPDSGPSGQKKAGKGQGRRGKGS